jgi:two-component system chemotaxis response regulator CheY
MDMASKDTFTALLHSRTSSGAPSDPASFKTEHSPRIRILIVDDDPDHREILKTRLHSLGYVCEEASDGQEGLYKLDHASFDLVMSDYQMPLMNGIQLIHAVRTTDGLSTVPIILMTGHSDPTVIDHARSAGATSILTKPYTLEHLQTALHGIWAKNRKPESG